MFALDRGIAIVERKPLGKRRPEVVNGEASNKGKKREGTVINKKENRALLALSNEIHLMNQRNGGS